MGGGPRLIVEIAPMVLFGVVWLGLVAILRWNLKKSVPYLVFFTIFYAYVFKVLDYTIFQFQSLVLLKYLMPDLILQGQETGAALNFLPLVSLTSADLRTSILNVLLFVPFGLGLPFITELRARGVVLAGAIVSVAIECLQFSMGWLSGTAFRVADINDVILNTLGAAIGYALFLGFVLIWRRNGRDGAAGSNPIVRHIIERPQMGGQSS